MSGDVFIVTVRWEPLGSISMVGHFCRRLSVGYSVGDGDQATCAENHDFPLPTLLRHRFEGMKHPVNKSNNTSNIKQLQNQSRHSKTSSLQPCPRSLSSKLSVCTDLWASHSLHVLLRSPNLTWSDQKSEGSTSHKMLQDVGRSNFEGMRQCSITQLGPGWIGTLIIVRQWAFGPGKTSVVQTSRYRLPWSSHHSTRCVQRAAKGNIQRCSQTKGLKIQIPLDHSVSRISHGYPIEHIANPCIPRHDHHFDSMAQGSKFWDMNLHVHHQPNLGGDLPWRFSYHQLPSYPVFALVRLWSLSVFRRNRP